jgi:hypothetical protein
MGCSAGGSPPDGGRDSDDFGLTGNQQPGRIEGQLTIGPLCPVERIPPDPRCAPTPELFAAVKVRILTPVGELVRTVDLDGSGNYAIDLGPGSYLVDTNYHGLGLPGGLEPGTGGADSGSAVGGSPDSAIAGPGDSTPLPGEPPFPGEPPSPGEPPFPGEPPPPGEPPFPGDSGPPFLEGPGEDGGPYRILPIAVEVQAGRTIRVDIDIDTGIR